MCSDPGGGGGKAGAFPTMPHQIRGALARARVREIKISGTARSGSMSTEADRGRYGNNCWGINQLGMLFPYAMMRGRE